MSFCLFPSRNTFRLVSPEPEQEKEAACYITTLYSVNLSVCVSRFSLRLLLSLPPLYCKLHRDMCTPLQIHTEQSNYCDNISAWLINCSPRAAALLLYIPKLFIPPQLHFHGSFGSHTPLFSLTFFPSFLLCLCLFSVSRLFSKADRLFSLFL